MYFALAIIVTEATLRLVPLLALSRVARNASARERQVVA